MISNIHALPYTAGDGKTGQGMANRTRSQVPTQPNLVGNIYNLQKKPRSIKVLSNLIHMTRGPLSEDHHDPNES